MNRRNRGVWVLGIAGVVTTGGLLGGCTTTHDISSSFDVGTSSGPRVQMDTPRQKGQMMVASDSLGTQVFKEDTSGGAYAAVPEE